uniref:Uncharacterized protein n=1 Tax=Sipha flava TaxID=143950 RepID=A0A2S2PX80_9HEMI
MRELSVRERRCHCGRRGAVGEGSVLPLPAQCTSPLRTRAAHMTDAAEEHDDDNDWTTDRAAAAASGTRAEVTELRFRRARGRRCSRHVAMCVLARESIYVERMTSDVAPLRRTLRNATCRPFPPSPPSISIHDGIPGDATQRKNAYDPGATPRPSPESQCTPHNNN